MRVSGSAARTFWTNALKAGEHLLRRFARRQVVGRRVEHIVFGRQGMTIRSANATESRDFEPPKPRLMTWLLREILCPGFHSRILELPRTKWRLAAADSFCPRFKGF